MAKPTTDKVQIQNSTLWMKQKEDGEGRQILIYDKESDVFPLTMVINRGVASKISARAVNIATPEGAKLMAKALEQAATIAADFETWWGE